MSWWDKVGESFDDGIGDLISAGIDRAAQEIAPSDSSNVSQNPNTHAITQDIGRNANGTTVTTPVSGSGFVAGLSNKKLLLIGGVAVLGVGLFLKLKK